MDEFLLIFLGEKTFNSVNVSEMIKSCLGDSFDVAAESQIWVYQSSKVMNLVSKGPSLKIFTNADPLLFATEQNDLSFVFILLQDLFFCAKSRWWKNMKD